MIRAEVSGSRSGFTLAEVAVTIVIVGIGMLLVLQGLNTAKMAAVQTKNLKLSRELALLTLGQIASGQFQEDIENGLHGTYAEEGYPDFSFDVVVGDDAFEETDENRAFDSWRPRTPAQQEENEERDEKDPQEVEDQPYEKVKIKITFPQILIEKEGLKHELVLEQWIPWKQVYGEKEDSEGKQDAVQAEMSGSQSGGKKP